jgi:hypothetical protein
MKTKWVVKRKTESGWVVLSEHMTEKDARFFWRGPKRKGENELIFEEVAFETLTVGN